MSDEWIPGQSPTYYPPGSVIQYPSGKYYVKEVKWRMMTEEEVAAYLERQQQ